MRFLTAVAIFLAIGAPASAAVVTQAADSGRTGWYPNQAGLTPGGVIAPGFGQVYQRSVDGSVRAQPLMANNRLVVVTEANTLYVLDPRDAGAAPVVQRTFGSPASPSPTCPDLVPKVGATATPVIDESAAGGAGVVYFTTKEADAGDATAPNGTWRVHAVNMSTGADLWTTTLEGFPADNVPATTFRSAPQLQRPGLLLVNGVLYMGFSSLCNEGDYQGWVVGVNATSGARTAAWVDIPAGANGGGIWQAGTGLGTDASGDIYVTTGNGLDHNGAGEPTNVATLPSQPVAGTLARQTYALSVVRLRPRSDGTLSPVDSFTPFNAPHLGAADLDLGSSGLTLLSHAFGTTRYPNVGLVAGKEGKLYLVNRDDLGGFRQGPAESDRVLYSATSGSQFGRAAAWPGDSGWAYITSAESFSAEPRGVQFWKKHGSGQAAPSLARCTTAADSSANGLGSTSPIVTTAPGPTSVGHAPLVWVVSSLTVRSDNAELRVYDGRPDCSGRPDPLRTWPIGRGARFNSPSVSGSRVWVGTADGRVIGFGPPAASGASGAR